MGLNEINIWLKNAHVVRKNCKYYICSPSLTLGVTGWEAGILDASTVHRRHIIYTLLVQNHRELHAHLFFFYLWEEAEAPRESQWWHGGRKWTRSLLAEAILLINSEAGWPRRKHGKTQEWSYSEFLMEWCQRKAPGSCFSQEISLEQKHYFLIYSRQCITLGNKYQIIYSSYILVFHFF